MKRCEHCHQLRECIPNRGRTMCSACSHAEITDQLKHEGFRCIENGREVTVTPGSIRPRARR